MSLPHGAVGWSAECDCTSFTFRHKLISISGTKEGSEVIPVTDIDTDTFKALLM